MPFQEAGEEEDIYSFYPLLRAKVWKRSLVQGPAMVVDVDDIRCHAAVWNFSAEKCVSVVLDRVSLALIRFICTDRKQRTWE